MISGGGTAEKFPPVPLLEVKPTRLLTGAEYPPSTRATT